MAGRLGIDFGTSNTVLALWDDAAKTSNLLTLPSFARPGARADQSVIPSVIHYQEPDTKFLGQEVFNHNLYQHPHTFRWMKRFISNRSAVKLKIGSRDISHFQAGADFLAGVISAALLENDCREDEVAFSAPVEAFEHYENWLAQVAENAGIRRFRLIDEPSAAALGYGAHIQPGNVYLIFDFGGGTLDVAIVKIEDDPSAPAGRHCRILGKSGADLGGATLDQWLFQELLRSQGKTDLDPDIRRISRDILVQCEFLKECLSQQEQAQFTIINPDTQAPVHFSLTRSRFEELLDEKEAFTRIDKSIRRALNVAHERGYDEDQIHSALMVGGSSQIPAIQRSVQRIFGRERTLLNRPLDAVARGAAAFVGGTQFFDHIQHDYAIRFVNPEKGEYDYRILVKKGTPYPTREPLAKLTVKATFAGQTQLGIAIFELSETRKQIEPQALELVFDPGGSARITEVSPEEQIRRQSFWLNENSPTFLPADPPAMKGEPRFQVEFTIDHNKRLLITSRDLKSDRITQHNFPVVKLS